MLVLCNYIWLDSVSQVATWLELSRKLMPNGRIMVNCGGTCSTIEKETNPEMLQSEATWLLNSTLQTLSIAFPGEVGRFSFHLPFQIFHKKPF